MSKMNSLILSGFVFTKPKVVATDKNGINNKAVEFDITIERNNINRIDVLTVKCYNDAAEKAIKLKKGDYIISEQANLRTINYQRRIECVCPQCHSLEERILESEKTEIVLSDFIYISKVYPQSIAGVNKLFLMGNVCSPLNNFRIGSDKAQSKFKLAVDRSGYMKKIQHADYPFVNCYGYEANYAAENFKVGSLLLVDGSVVQRKITQSFDMLCPECETRYTKEVENNVVEGVGFKIQNLKFAETKSIEELNQVIKEDEENILTIEDTKGNVPVVKETKIKENAIDDEEDIFDIMSLIEGEHE